MSMKAGTFDSIIPSRYISFTLPIASLPPSQFQSHYLFTKHLQISVLDSPTQQQQQQQQQQLPKYVPLSGTTDITALPLLPNVAAMLVPKNRENDWIFNTEAGHLQLLLSSPRISRLILIGNTPNFDKKTYTRSVENEKEKDPSYREEVESSLYPLLMALLPKEVAQRGNCQVPFLSYEDNVVSSVVLETCVGPCVGEMLVEDVEFEGSGSSRGFRRRLRFKRMPNLVQTEIVVTPSGVYHDCLNSLRIEEAEFLPDLGVLVHPYLAPMVAGLSLIGRYIEGRIETGVNPRACCVGVGGGALLSFLSKQLGFEVIGLELDEVVLRVAKQYFGLQTSKGGIQICVGDGIDILKNIACQLNQNDSSPLLVTNIRNDGFENDIDAFRSKFDVIMVDLDSNDSKMGISAPALEFVEKDVLQAAKSCLFENGILVLNVIPPNESFYGSLIHELREVFVNLHEIDCGNDENFVLVASMSANVADPRICENAFIGKLRSVIPGAFMDCIRKI